MTHGTAMLQPDTLPAANRVLTRRLTRLLGGLWLLLATGLQPALGEQPAVLIVSPQGAANGWVDLAYLNELHQAGFEVDYTESMAEVTWERLKQYHVLVLYSCPPDAGVDAWPFLGKQPIYKQDFMALVDRFLASGGGVFLIAVETQIRTTLVRDLIQPWGADLPLETIIDPANSAFMTRMPRVPLAYTNQIASSPVSAGVRGIWYPIQPHYNAADTLPLALDDSWQVVVRAMPSARTVPVDLSKSAYPGPPHPLVRADGVSAPPLLGIRPYGSGRIALMSQWAAYALGAGTKWLYNREVLSRGLNGKPSDVDRLLANSLRWLAAPSLQSHALGGYVTAPGRLTPPNQRAQIRQQFRESASTGVDPSLAAAPRDTTLFKGLIGVQTALSSGRGTVADYAAAAKQAGLDFLVFLEDFSALDADKLAHLKSDCQQYSSDAVTLFPGYRIDNNIGNHMFVFGPGTVMPPDRLRTGPGHKTFMVQGETSPGVFGSTPPAAEDFLWSLTPNTQIGYYDFAHSGMGMRLSDARLYAMAAVRTYRDGVLIDDAVADYLTTVQSTIAPAPVAVDLISSPSAIASEVSAGQGLTYVLARSRAQIWSDALDYTDQYTCPNVFTSTGPLIMRWPACMRVATLGAEPFVTGRSLMTAPIYVTSDKGLREVRLYDGQQLYRRFPLNGAPVFSTILQLEGTIQHDLVLIAEDVAGGQAISAARRSWKDGSLAPVFCSDRINDCGNMLMAHGPYPMPVLRTPEISDPGFTWDGGPKGILTPVDFEGSNPKLETDHSVIDGDRYNQTPLLEFADEGAVAVESVRDELIDPRVPAENPWHTYGPRVPAQGMQFTLRYTQFDRASIDVPSTGWAAPPVQTGCNAALFRGDITFTAPLTVKSLRLLRNWNWISSVPIHVVVGRNAEVVRDLDVASTTAEQRFTLLPGDWFGFYTSGTGNSQFLINRGQPIELHVGRRQNGEWVSLWAMPPTTSVHAGQSYPYELFGVGCPLDAAAHSASEFTNALAYLDRPQGLQVLRGQRLPSRGVLELQPDNYIARVVLNKPSTTTNLTLPVVVNTLNRRWTAGLWQVAGYVKGDYGVGSNRYRAVGLDFDGRAYVPLFPDLAAQTDVMIGHPVVADARGRDLFIQVTPLSGGTTANPDYNWSVVVNNPTDQPIATVLSQTMELPNLQVDTREVTFAPGESREMINSRSALSRQRSASLQAPTRTATPTATPTDPFGSSRSTPSITSGGR